MRGSCEDETKVRMPSIVRGFWIVAPAVLLAACSSCGDELPRATPASGKKPMLQITIAGEEVLLEVALTDEERAQGLMGRKSLEEKRGMLFVYPEPRIMRFWMKDTMIPLSIAFLKEDGTIANIEEMRPYVVSPSYLSKGKCRYALEMPGGWFAARGIEAGDKIDLGPKIRALTPQ